MRAARKRKQLTQVAVAQRLQISQSALSKIESGLLIPSAPQWFEFCGLTEISPDSLVTGYIERANPAIPMILENSNVEAGFKLPKSYREARGSKMRAMMPFVMYFRTAAGERKVEDYFQHIRMDEDILTDRDSQVNLNFCLDLCRTMIISGWLKGADIAKLAEPAISPFVHGSLHRQYVDQPRGVETFEKLIGNSRRYECNFKYEIANKSKNQVDLRISPEAHLHDFSYRNDPVLVDFLCRYKQHYFGQFVAYNGGAQATVQELQCHYKGADSCVYRLNF